MSNFKINVLSCFDGMSCGQEALKQLSIPINKYYASEIDKDAIAVTQYNFPKTIQLGDITKLHNVKTLNIDLLIGGSPCQGFSFAGKQLNFNDPRSKLFFEFVRLKREISPNYFLLENVNMKKEYQDIITKELGCEPIKINSSLISPARRNRLYWTNIIVDCIVPNNLTFDDINQGGQDWIAPDKIRRISNWKAQQKPLKNATLIGSGSKLPCLTARGYNQYHSGMVLITDGTNYRYLSHEEAELAHGLPIGYTKIVSDNSRSKMIGNGWDIRVIKHIFKNLNNNEI